ncbi:cAMP-specific phosphodiesterase Cgs2 [Schizosaccharomyces japonicus yFS275]|uniref:cAMP-specific phosphodiesterase Cgs2 n=1 Tax=Schizosaccharomyces japonicus (strain yFS275 / FY16936) TaxID=402676 RepID=B6K2L4_SCHJY|nr:cAMP-specific phosphodiesterase Cgs2 [Schizosaccharomyces japonicus yFS275]EEB07395.2 cAMP-specific phosphodiesterase Cgs2 [Schizosaccharomyces japonicus yFS275]
MWATAWNEPSGPILPVQFCCSGNRFKMAEEASFTLVSLGNNGGPLETHCSGHLVSDAHFEEVISIDGGTHLSSLIELVENSPFLDTISKWKKSSDNEDDGVENKNDASSCSGAKKHRNDSDEDMDSVSNQSSRKAPRETSPLASTSSHAEGQSFSVGDVHEVIAIKESGDSSPDSNCLVEDSNTSTDSEDAAPGFYKLTQAYGCAIPTKIDENISTSYYKAWLLSEERIHTFLISHCHIDHLAGLIINSAVFTTEHPRQIAALDFNIESMKKHIFNNIVWPALDQAGFLIYKSISPDLYSPITSTLHVRPFIVSHGCSFGHTVLSSAFLLRNVTTDHYFIAFGDVEADQTSGKHYNHEIWETIAPLIQQDKLKYITVECSTVDVPNELLFGHMCPNTLVHELHSLQQMVTNLGGNTHNVTCLICHIKSDPRHTSSASDAILQELHSHAEEVSLDMKFEVLQPHSIYRF